MLKSVLPLIERNQAVNKLAKEGRVNEARHVFDSMAYRDEYAWNTMISGYVRWGRYEEAEELFQKVPTRSSITWSILISSHSKRGHDSEAFHLLREMQLHGCRPTEYTLGSTITLCSETFNLLRGQFLHALAVKSRLDKSFHVVTGLVDMYAKCRMLPEAEMVFKSALGSKHDATWTAMINGYSINGEDLKAIGAFAEMMEQGIAPNEFTYHSFFTACSSRRRDVGIQGHCSVLKAGHARSVLVQSALVGMYSKWGDVASGRRALDDVGIGNTVPWNFMITECSRQGLHSEAIQLFKTMHDMEMEIDHYTYAPVLNSFAVTQSDSLHCMIVKAGFVSCTIVGNAVIDMYAKQGRFDDAFKVFDKMLTRDVVSWTSLVTGFSCHQMYLEAAKVFCRMRIACVKPDFMALASVIISCAELTAVGLGEQIHGFIVKHGVSSSVRVGNSLVTMYSKCGNMTNARKVFDEMRIRDVITWTALIIGNAQNGRGEEALAIYNKMKQAKVKPDFVTFVGVLFACSHARLVEEGQQYFAAMKDEYGVVPGAEHYACMIDLLGRSGKLEEAKRLIEAMTVKDDGTGWIALLSACRIHGAVELGESAAMKVLELDPANAVPYIMLANMYSETGRWEETARVRKVMKERGVKKAPGCSWMEIGGEMHTFMCEERKHKRIEEVYVKLEEMMEKIKMAGYVPDMKFVLHDVDEEGKERGLAYHSEKLAVAFGILAMPDAAPIRVFKNLRVCGDCHTAMKYISCAYNRYIVLRDSNCFHHFRDGDCSCGDYW